MAYSGMHLSFWKFYFNISIHPLSPFYFADIPSVIASFRHTWGKACLLFWPYSCSGVRRQTDLVQTKKATNWPSADKKGNKLTLASNYWLWPQQRNLDLFIAQATWWQTDLVLEHNKTYLDFVIIQAIRRQTDFDKQTLIVLDLAKWPWHCVWSGN